MKLSERLNKIFNDTYTVVTSTVAKIIKPAKKYIPAAMIVFGSVGQAKAAPKQDAVDLGKKAGNTLVTNARKSDGKFVFNKMHFDAKTMHVEDLNTIYAAGNKFDAMYGGNTIQTVKDFGPMLTNMDDLKRFINKYSDKYSDLSEVVKKYGIRSDEFLKAWMKYDVDGKRQMITNDIIEYSWDKKYQPIFDANEKFGYPKITKETRNNPETFGYVASVITCMGQSSRQTVGIYKEAAQRANQQLGDKATLDDFIDISYDIRHERWGLSKRYFGNDGKSGEKHLNKKTREMMASIGKEKATTVSFDAVRADVTGKMEAKRVEKTDAIKVETTDSIEKMELYKVEQKEDSAQNGKSLLEGLLDKSNQVANIPEFSAGTMEVFLRGFSLSLSQPEQLEAERQKTYEEIEQLKGRANEISYDNYGFMGKNIQIDYEELINHPEAVGHLPESGRNPIIKDSKSIKTTQAMGLYQFNMNNTMKLLADKLADEFPLLKEAKDKHGVRSTEYEKAWVYYSTGLQHERFEARQLEFMFDIAYKRSFDYMTKNFNAPKITMENYNDKEHCVYTGAMMSVVNQSPRQSTRFMKLAYERVKSKSKTGEINWNQVGVVVNDIKAEKWGKRRALYRRYMGSKYNLGEKQISENMCRYIDEMPKLQAQINEKENKLRYLDYALNTIRGNNLDYMASNSIDTDKEAKAQSIQANKDKYMKIQVHVRNMKEWHKAKQMAKNNSNVEIANSQTHVSRGNRGNGNEGHHRT